MISVMTSHRVFQLFLSAPHEWDGNPREIIQHCLTPALRQLRALVAHQTAQLAPFAPNASFPLGTYPGSQTYEANNTLSAAARTRQLQCRDL